MTADSQTPTPRTWRTWDEVEVGDPLGPLAFPLPLYRLVMAAGATRDFNAIHHNTDAARASGASDAYANFTFLFGMWERTVREFTGPAGELRQVRGFRMKSFNAAGDTPVVGGQVTRKWIEDGQALVEFSIATQNAGRVSVGPGTVVVALPRQA